MSDGRHWLNTHFYFHFSCHCHGFSKDGVDQCGLSTTNLPNNSHQRTAINVHVDATVRCHEYIMNTSI